jgi:uncharacterized membrane protein
MAIRWRRAIGPALLLAGLLVLAFAVATGAARLYLVVIFPVLTSGSPIFLLGVVLLVAGFLTLPWVLAPEEPPVGAEERPVAPAGRPPGPGAAVGGGGLVLVGPVPVFFGAWKNPSRRVYWLAVLAGTLALALLVAVLLRVF